MGQYSLVIDGGTTNLRVTLLDAAGAILSTVKSEAGVSHTAIDGHNGRLKNALREAIGSLLSTASLTASDIAHCVAYGMITSREGLVEIPHLTAPTDVQALHQGMVMKSFADIASFPIAFIPGVKNDADTNTLDSFTAMDMMRGEETEAMGLWPLVRPVGPCVFVLPGSHNKLIQMGAAGQIQSCMTILSGELTNALTHHTILASAVEHSFATPEDFDMEMALVGYQEAEKAGLGRAAFAGRILSTLYKKPPQQVASYLLGAVLQSDIQALKAYATVHTPLYIAGKEPLQTALCGLAHAAGFTQVHPVKHETAGRMGVTGALRIAGMKF